MDILDIKKEFLKEFDKIDKPEIILSLRNFLNELKEKEINSSDWEQFAGIWSDKEANEILSTIEDCEKIDLKEW